MTDRLWAALMFFTRLPLWHIRKADTESFKHVVDYWPLVGWCTGGVMALAYIAAAAVLPPVAAILVAVVCRLLLTGALHEDGLADFCDGFGGGTTPARTLAIMKDSHIGTYGVLGLVFYVALWVTLVSALPRPVAAAALFTADVYGKVCASFLIMQLPYARTAEQAKSGVVYSVWKGKELAAHVVRCAVALLPCAVWIGIGPAPYPYWALAVPPIVELLLVQWMRRRIQGYTGDCCGAAFLLCELSLHLAVVAGYSYIL